MKPEESLSDYLSTLSERYETPDFIREDPSWFMHQSSNPDNQEAIAFVAAALSYGNRRQFMQKIQTIMRWANNDMDSYIREGRFKNHFSPDDNRAFYRLYSYAMMHDFFAAYQQLLLHYDTLGQYVEHRASTGLDAISCITSYFSQHNVKTIIPKNCQSACKRLCMFLRWMVRSGSPVDLGLWEKFIDRRSLIMPLDTHVLTQANNLGLISSRNASMKTAITLTNRLAKIFPGDPLRGDFALFGYGVNNKSSASG